MKNKDIHQQLDQPNIRDFLASHCKTACYIGEVEYLVNQIVLLKERLELAKNYEAIQQIIKGHGWDQHDISDDIEDYLNDTYFPFIGTEKELEDLNL